MGWSPLLRAALRTYPLLPSTEKTQILDSIGEKSSLQGLKPRGIFPES
jgi:hypothetical protein